MQVAMDAAPEAKIVIARRSRRAGQIERLASTEEGGVL